MNSTTRRDFTRSAALAGAGMLWARASRRIAEPAHAVPVFEAPAEAELRRAGAPPSSRWASMAWTSRFGRTATCCRSAPPKICRVPSKRIRAQGLTVPMITTGLTSPIRSRGAAHADDRRAPGRAIFSSWGTRTIPMAFRLNRVSRKFAAMSPGWWPSAKSMASRPDFTITPAITSGRRYGTRAPSSAIWTRAGSATISIRATPPPRAARAAG